MTEQYDDVVSLGMCCEPVFVIQHFKLSNLSYPFDWSVIPSIEDLCDIINDDFEGYFDFEIKDYIGIPKTSISFYCAPAPLRRRIRETIFVENTTL